jgi:hypothetical protein
MCVHCEGRSVAEVLAAYRQCIRVRGWALVSVAPAGGRTGFCYTIGMTRHHDHPELLASGLPTREARALLDDLVERVRGGQRLRAGEVLTPDGEYRLQLLRVADPGQLDHAQAVYAGPRTPVQALQVVWSDEAGHWPWQPGWGGQLSDQPLFGLPLHH